MATPRLPASAIVNTSTTRGGPSRGGAPTSRSRRGPLCTRPRALEHRRTPRGAARCSSRLRGRSSCNGGVDLHREVGRRVAGARVRVDEARRVRDAHGRAGTSRRCGRGRFSTVCQKPSRPSAKPRLDASHSTSQRRSSHGPDRCRSNAVGEQKNRLQTLQRHARDPTRRRGPLLGVRKSRGNVLIVWSLSLGLHSRWNRTPLGSSPRGMHLRNQLPHHGPHEHSCELVE